MIALAFWLCIGTVLYAYAGYPALIVLLSRARQPRAVPPAPPPTVTLLIAAYDEEDVIERKLENSLSLEYPRLVQIIVAADGSQDGTVEIVRRFSDRGVELSYDPARGGKMAAINNAFGRVRHDIVVFSDANNLYDPRALIELTRPFADPTVGAVTGWKSVEVEDASLSSSEALYWRYESVIKQAESRMGCCTAVTGEIFALRRDLFESPPADIINDDFYMAMQTVRKGYRVAYAPAARSLERVSPTARDEITRRTRIIAGRYQAMLRLRQFLPLDRPVVIWQVLSHKFLRPLVPFAMLGAAATNVIAALRPHRRGRHPLLGLARPWSSVFLGLQAAFYSLAILGGRGVLPGRAGRLAYICTFLVNSNAAAVLGLARFLRRRQSAAWQRVARRQR